MFFAWLLAFACPVIGQPEVKTQIAEDQLPLPTRCATVQNARQYAQKSAKGAKYAMSNLPGGSEFESWMQYHIDNTTQTYTFPDTAIKTIPVVVHIISAGEPIGVKRNISDDQVHSQITVLNQDYGKMINTNGYNTDSSGVDTRIRFVLANRDPNNLFTTGIVRIADTVRADSFWSYTNTRLKKLSYWPNNRYLNIWVADLNVLGYAQYPISSLAGLSNVPATADSTDGIVINYNAFGLSGRAGGNYNLGRSATHEIGHFFGLLHCWGDQYGCTGTDYCNDTPTETDEEYHCPIGRVSCTDHTKPDMVPNYMNYTDDRCMNIFTADQLKRMNTVLKYSPNRGALVNSGGYQPTGIGNNLKADNITVVPQIGATATYSLYFSGDTGYPVDIVVSDVLGRCFYTDKFTVSGKGYKQDITLQGYPSGMYLVQLGFKGNKVVKRIFVD